MDYMKCSTIFCLVILKIFFINNITLNIYNFNQNFAKHGIIENKQILCDHLQIQKFGKIWLIF